MGSNSFSWSRLPFDIVPLILVNLHEKAQCAFAATSRENMRIVRDEPALVYRQKALRDATFDKRGDACLQALQAHRAALRCAAASFMLPLNPPRGFVLAVASLVAGSAQRPCASYTPEQLQAVGDLPPQVDVLLNCAWRGLGADVGRFEWPRGVHGIDLQSNGLSWWAGDLQLPDGVTYVNLARNALGDSNRFLHFPDSVREVVLSDNWICVQDRMALRARYPKIRFHY